MRKQNFALVLATVIVLAAMPIMAVDGAGAEIAEVETETADLSVSVYVGSPEYEFSESAVTDVEQMRQMTDSVELVDSLSVITGSDTVVVINEATINTKKAVADELVNLSGQGNPIIVVSGTPELFTINQDLYSFVGFMEDADIYCMGMARDGGTICHSISGYDKDESLKQAYAWAASVNTYSNDIESEGLLYSQYYSYNEKCSVWGYMNGVTTVSQIQDSNDDANFYLVHYNHGGNLLTGDAMSDLTVSSNVGAYDQAIMDHAPRNQPNVTTVTFTKSGCVGSDGMSAEFSASWSHTYSSVEVEDRTNLGAGEFEVFYNIDEGSSTGQKVLFVEPGMVVRTDEADGSYHATDTLSITYCNVIIQGYWFSDYQSFHKDINWTMNPQD